MKEKVNINDRSIESAGIPKDYKEALAELIWNGFDAKASRVEISFDANEIDHVHEVRVRDNGYGISHETLPQTFGTLLDSLKKISYQRSSYVRGQKGKGRFSFTAFARQATWHTVTNLHGQFEEFSIRIRSNNKDEYELTPTIPSTKSNTGTEVVLTQLFGVTAGSFTSDEFYEFLCQQFGWFLFLNRKNSFSLVVNGEELNYSSIIAEYDVKAVILDDPMEEEQAHSFDLTYIRWKTRIGDRYYYYYLNDKKREVAKQLTSFNNNAIDFHHSLYIESDFFNEFGMDAEDPGSRLIGKNQSHPVFRALHRELHEYLEIKEAEFIRTEAANRLIQEYQIGGIVSPPQANNAFLKSRQEGLERLIRELYSLQPNLFKGLKKEQQRAFTGLLRLAVDQANPSQLFGVLKGLIPEDDPGRATLEQMIHQPDIQQVTQLLQMIVRRFGALQMLQYLTRSETNFQTHKAELRNLLEQNTWMVDEAFQYMAGDAAFEEVVRDGLSMLDGRKRATRNGQSLPERQHALIFRRMALPVIQKEEKLPMQNLLLDAKSPETILVKEHQKQAEVYLRYLMKDPQLGGEHQRWRMYLLASKVDTYISDQYQSLEAKKKPFLIKSSRDFDIYAIRYEDLYRNFIDTTQLLIARQPYPRGTLEEYLAQEGVILDYKLAFGPESEIPVERLEFVGPL
ncbi:MAG: ATP-binding protein [Bacteroidota bacterium]